MLLFSIHYSSRLHTICTFSIIFRKLLAREIDLYDFRRPSLEMNTTKIFFPLRGVGFASEHEVKEINNK